MSYGSPSIPGALPDFEDNSTSSVWHSFIRLFILSRGASNFCEFGISVNTCLLASSCAVSSSGDVSACWMVSWYVLAISAISSDFVVYLFVLGIFSLWIISLSDLSLLIRDQYLLIISPWFAHFVCALRLDFRWLFFCRWLISCSSMILFSRASSDMSMFCMFCVDRRSVVKVFIRWLILFR